MTNWIWDVRPWVVLGLASFAVLRTKRSSLVIPSPWSWASVSSDGCATRARALGSNNALVSSPDTVAYERNTPMLRLAVVSMNDPLKAVSVESQHAVHPKLPRYANTRARRARLNRRKVAVVVNPANPGLSPNGKVRLPPDSVPAESTWAR